MRINIDSTWYDVDILKTFKPTYRQSTKFTRSINGKYRGSDRGVLSDKFATTFTIIGDIADINILASALYLEAGTVIVDAEGAQIFGSAIDYSSTFFALASKPTNYNIRDLVTATITLSIIPTKVPEYLSSVSATLPDLFYQWPVNRSLNDRNTPQRPLNDDNNYTTVIVDGSGDPIKSESATVRFDMTGDEFAQLQKFHGVNRLTPFTLNTSVCLELFLNSTSTSVIITKLGFKPNGIDRWTASLILVNNI